MEEKNADFFCLSPHQALNVNNDAFLPSFLPPWQWKTLYEDEYQSSSLHSNLIRSFHHSSSLFHLTSSLLNMCHWSIHKLDNIVNRTNILTSTLFIQLYNLAWNTIVNRIVPAFDYLEILCATSNLES